MQGYDKNKALQYLCVHVLAKEHKELSDLLPELLGMCIDLELEYMQYAGVIDKDGYASDGIYDDDDAIEFILEGIIAKGNYTPEQCADIAVLIDDYLAKHSDYLESIGLLSYD